MRRRVNFNVDESGGVDKRIPQFGGVRGEHHATEIVFTMSATAPYKQGDLVRLRFVCGDGAVLSSDLVEDVIVQDGRMRVAYALPSVLTQAGGQLGVRVVFSRVDEDGRESETFLTEEAVLYFEDSVSENGTPFWTGVSEMLKRTTTASNAAVAARDAARNEKEAAEASAETAERFADAASEKAVEAVSAEENAQLYASEALSHRDDAEKAASDARSASSSAQDAARIADEASGKAAKAQSDAVLAAQRAEEAKEEVVAVGGRIDRIEGDVDTANTLIQQLAQKKLSKSGHAPNKFLGTDSQGNVVEKEAPEGGGGSATDEQVQNAVDNYLDRNPVKDGTSVSVASVNESTVDGGTNIVTFSDGKKLSVKNGERGTSVSVASVTESTESGGANTVTFTDGKKLSVKNGKDGKDGDPYTLTGADKTAIVQSVVESLGVPVFGTVDDDKTITLNEELPEGVYTLRYLTDEGYADIGTITVGAPIPSYVNLVPTALTHTDLSTVFNGIGYKDGVRASSSSPFTSAQEGYVLTGAIPVLFDTVLYIKGVTINPNDINTRFAFAKTYNNAVNPYAVTNTTINGNHCTMETLGEQYYKVTFNAEYLQASCSELSHFFLSAVGSGENLIVATTPIL